MHTLRATRLDYKVFVHFINKFYKAKHKLSCTFNKIKAYLLEKKFAYSTNISLKKSIFFDKLNILFLVVSNIY